MPTISGWFKNELMCATATFLSRFSISTIAIARPPALPMKLILLPAIFTINSRRNSVRNLFPPFSTYSLHIGINMKVLPAISFVVRTSVCVRQLHVKAPTIDHPKPKIASVGDKWMLRWMIHPINSLRQRLCSYHIQPKQSIILLRDEIYIMKVAALFTAFAATANAFAPSSSFTSSLSVSQVGNGNSALSMAMERTYIMVRCRIA